MREDLKVDLRSVEGRIFTSLLSAGCQIVDRSLRWRKRRDKKRDNQGGKLNDGKLTGRQPSIYKHKSSAATAALREESKNKVISGANRGGFLEIKWREGKLNLAAINGVNRVAPQRPSSLFSHFAIPF